MGLDTIIARIHDDAQKEASRIRADAQAEAKQIEATGALEAEKAYQTIILLASRDIRQKRAQLRSRALIEARTIIRQEKEDQINRCFENALLELETIREKEKYRAVLLRLINDGISSVHSDSYTITVDDRDREITGEIISVLKEDTDEISIRTGSIRTAGGALIAGSHGVMVDNTFEARLARYKKELLYRVARILLEKEPGIA
ncbi:MAG: V-type ATP synthase subunit E [Methanospirillaceae archaeon]|nr:V-type ATP synthase subunit E [Methanospirillaceae archaeon]